MDERGRIQERERCCSGIGGLGTADEAAERRLRNAWPGAPGGTYLLTWLDSAGRTVKILLLRKTNKKRISRKRVRVRARRSVSKLYFGRLYDDDDDDDDGAATTVDSRRFWCFLSVHLLGSFTLWRLLYEKKKLK